MRAALALALAAALVGCGEQPLPAKPMRDGYPVIPPDGWRAWCERNPQDPSCARPSS